MLLFLTMLLSCPGGRADAAALSDRSAAMTLGSNKTVRLTGAKGSATWRSTDTDVIKVRKKSKYKVIVTAVGEGEAKLKVKNKGKTYTCRFTVVDEADSEEDGAAAAGESAEEDSRGEGEVKQPSTSQVLQIGSNTPVYTGVSTIDYMTEIYLSRAGVKAGMTEEQAVLAIWTFIAKNMRYQEDINKYGCSVPKSLDITSSSAKAAIKKYKASADKLKSQGKIKYNSKYVKKRARYGSPIKIVSQNSSVLKNAMRRFIGKCTENSSAFTVMCNHIGIKAGKAAGKEYGEDHTWSWATVNGKKRYYDIGAAVHKMGRGKGFSTSNKIYAVKEENQADCHLDMRIAW